jgi:hypothetical protein
MYEQSQQSDWLQTELESMSLQAASPAKTSQSQETKQEYKMGHAVDSGQSAPVFLGSFDPNTPSLKTSQTCLMENGDLGLSEFSGTFPRSGMMRNGTVYQLPRLARTTTEIGSGLLPTPTAASSQSASMEASLKEAQRLHPKGRNHLAAEVASRIWPTPTAHNAKEGAFPSEYNRNTPTLAAQAGGALNPTWVEWLMGFPLGHTDLNA